MKQTKYTVCDICGASVKARGIGGHKSLVHGVVDRVVVSGSNTSVQRPSDYVKKKSEVIEIRREPAPVQTIPDPAPEIKDRWDIHYPGVSVISDKGAAIYSELCRIGDHSLEAYKRVKKELGY